MKHKDLKPEIRYFNDMHIQPILTDDFLRLNMYNFVRNEFKAEAQKLQPAGTGKIDFTNVYNMSNAWDYILTNLDHQPITINQIASINRIISQNNNEGITGGVYRYSFVNIFGQPAPNPETIYNSLDNALYKMNSSTDSILTRAFNIHYDIIVLQPFNDFNKRTARIVMNWFLLKNNYTPILFNHKDDDTEYTASLKSRLKDQNTRKYTAYMCDRMHKTQFMILRMLRERIH